MTAEVRFDEAQVEDYLKLLSGITNGYERAASRSINKAVTKTRTGISKAIRQVVTLKAKPVKDAIKVKKASISDLSGRVTVKGKGIPLIQYRAKFLKASRRGVNYQVFKSGGKKNLRHAFIAMMPSGHIGVFVREKQTAGPGFAGRLPIRELFGPSIPSVLAETPGVLEDVEEASADILIEEMERQVDLLLQTS